MITVEIIKNQGRTLGFSAHGHAMYDEYGHDIVCSAVSALTQTALLGLLDVVKAKVEYSISDDGFIECKLLDNPDETAEKAELVLNVMKTGLCNIQENYNKYLSVTEREETENV